ncbi:class I adenylate-forming enzyme family protein [Streptomyces mobaraensis]|uniref:AMP-binding protein n=1 Tax=Streptomyces mobaraensis TaxID=35621 RepID=A0A5N5W117_STRMB|nr:AMP-binding protein [Streptomyces mobaraensis]KAB7834288.1 AMP-binding protein [Streptomyces mobaraensis]
MSHTPVYDLLTRAAGEHPDRPAVRDAAGRWSYAQLAAHSRRTAAWLAGRGVGHGDRVMVRLASGREYLALLYGTLALGAVLVPVNPAMRDFQLRGVIEDAEPALVVTDPAHTDAVRALTGRPVLGLDEAWAEIAEQEPAPVTTTAISRDVALLMYTSGTTSRPKAVVSEHAQVLAATRAVAARLRYRADDVVYCRLPLSFDYGLYQVFLAALAGAEIVVPGEVPDVMLLRGIRETAATVVPLVPSLSEMLVRLAARDPEPTSVRLFTNTGAALPPPSVAALRAAFPGASVSLMYGITECKRVSILEPDEDLDRPGSVGRPLPDTEVLVVDDGGRPLPPGETGEFVVRGPHVMSGYWRAPEQTARRFRRCERTGEVRLFTGDYGHRDAEGHLYFSGRRDDIFKRLGMRVSTLEVEAAALDVPGVREAVALAPDGSRDLTLFVVGGPEPAEVRRELRARLEAAKVPAAVLTVPAIPLTGNGKPDRKALAAGLA